MDLTKALVRMGDSYRNGTESCPVAGFGISSAREVVN